MLKMDINNMFKKIKCLLFITCIIFLPINSWSASIPVDLLTFYADPVVSISSNGSSANMMEDEFLSTILLSNDPFFGDPGISVPPDLQSLTFDYIFRESELDDNGFYAKVFDGETGDLINDFFVDDNDAGTITWYLNILPGNITLLGLEFQLNSYESDEALDAVVQIRNVQLLTTTVPLPGAFLLFTSALIWLRVFLPRSIH